MRPSFQAVLYCNHLKKQTRGDRKLSKGDAKTIESKLDHMEQEIKSIQVALKKETVGTDKLVSGSRLNTGLNSDREKEMLSSVSIR